MPARLHHSAEQNDVRFGHGIYNSRRESNVELYRTYQQYNMLSSFISILISSTSPPLVRRSGGGGEGGRLPSSCAVEDYMQLDGQ